PVAMRDGATRAVLEALFFERFNSHELRRLRGAPTRQEPACEPGAGETPASAQSSAERSGSPSPSDAYRRIFETLRDAEVLDEADLAALGKARGEAIRAELEAGGLAAERM